MIRVLHFSHIINRYDFADNVVRYCDPTVFKPYVCTFTARSNIQAPEYGAETPHFVLDCNGRQDYPLGVFRLKRILQKHNIDIVHTHHFDPALIGVVAARWAGVPGVVIGRHYSVTLQRIEQRWKSHLYFAMESFHNAMADRVIVPSAMIRDILVEGQGVDRGKVVQIPYGFDLSKYRPSVSDARRRVRAEFLLENHFVLGCFGRLHREKGQTYLLQAMKKLVETESTIRLLIVGDGPDAQGLEQCARDLGIRGNVVFTGWRTDVVDLMTAVDVVVQPSLQEAFPQVMVEAMIMGRPVVITDVSGARDVIGDNVNGLLVPCQDADALCEAVLKLYRNPEFASRLGENGRTYVTENLDIREVVKRYEACYLELHRAKGAGPGG